MLRRSYVLILLLSSIIVSAQNTLGPGNALEFNGVNQYVNLGTSTTNLSFPLSISFWVKTASRTTQNQVFASCNTADANYYGVWLHLRNDKLNMGVGNGIGGLGSSGRRTYRVTLTNFYGEWMHVAAVWTSINNMKVYINGTEVAGVYEGTATTMAGSASGTGALGLQKRAFDDYFDGQLDEFTLWDKALTQAEVRSLMCSKFDTSNPNLLLGLSMNDAVSSSSLNASGSLNATPTRIGATTIASTAPVGDESVFQYAGGGTFNNQSVSLSLGGQVFRVSGLSSPSRGVHLYRIANDTTIDSTNCYLRDTWGVFVADNDYQSSDAWNVTCTSASSIQKKRSNVTGVWTATSPTVSALTYQSEFVLLPPSLPIQFLPNDTVVCYGDSVLVNLPSDYSYAWDDGDSSNSRYLQGGVYEVEAYGVTCVNKLDTITVGEYAPVSFSLPNDTIMCFGEKLQVALPSTYSYSWNDGSIDANRLLGAGNYIVTATTSSGCTKTDTLLVSEYFPIITALPSDTVVCYGDSFSVNLPSLYSYVWDDNTTSASKNLGPGNHYVTASLNGCSVTDTIAIIENPEIVIPLGSDTTICFGDSVEVVLSTAYSYIWSDGSIEHRRYLKDGIYTVLATDGRCYQSHQIEVVELAPIRGAFTDSISCDSVHYPVSLNVVAQWSDGVVGDRYLQPGESYSVTLSNGICSLTEQVSVTMGEPMEFNLPYSDTICENQYIQVQIPSDGVSSVQWNDGSTEFERTLMTTGEYIVTAQTDCGEVVDTINVYVVDCGALDIIIPNAFTPNGDGTNDVFIIPGLEGLDFKWRVMDRWGNVVFETSTNGVGWDGTFQGADVQMETYLVEFTYKDYLGTRHKINRFVFLYR